MGMSLREPQGLPAPNPHVPPTLCTGAAGGKPEGVRMGTDCKWRMASSPAVNFLPTRAQNDRHMGCLRCSLFAPVLLFLSLSAFYLSRWDFPLSLCVPVFLLLFQLLSYNEYRSPWLLYSTVPRTTFIYICSWNEDGKNSLKAMEIGREGSIMHCALLSWIAKRWKPCWLELTFPMSQS